MSPQEGSGPRSVSLVASESEGGERVDKTLAARLAGSGYSRSVIARWCDEGRVSVAGAKVRPSAKLKAGDTVLVQVPVREPCEAQAEDIALAVLFEDKELLVINKPAGMVVHPSAGHPSKTLVNAVLHHADLDRDDPLRPGIVHRIDKDTSGLLVIAKTSMAREGLSEQFKAHSVTRSYLALTEGVPSQRVTYDTLHGRHPIDRLRFSGRVREGKRAVTHVEVLVAFGAAAALVRCSLETGRTHQIRMHLAEAGFPLLGDRLYGRRPREALVAQIADALGRQGLHAQELGFVHPITREELRFLAEPPYDFARAVESLRSIGA